MDNQHTKEATSHPMEPATCLLKNVEIKPTDSVHMDREVKPVTSVPFDKEHKPTTMPCVMCQVPGTTNDLMNWFVCLQVPVMCLRRDTSSV